MGSSQSFPQDKKIVVVGGGYGGMTLACGLKKGHANYTLVDGRDSFHHSMGASRAAVESGFAEKTFIPYEKTFGSHFKKGHVSGIDPVARTVSLATGDTLSYDVLVVALGSSVDFPGKVEEVDGKEACQRYEEIIRKIKASQRIAVVGGGPVGVELASEIATDYPEKEVIIIHSKAKLVGDFLTEAFHKRMNEILDGLNITRITNERVTNLHELRNCDANTVTTDKGRSIVADLVMKCIGFRVNSKPYEKNFAHVMERNGQLQVDQFLRVKGYKDVYAIGDCNNVPELKLALLAREQARCTLENIHRQLGADERPLQAYTLNNQPFRMCLSFGRLAGMGENKKGQLMSEFIVRRLKSKSCFVERYWSDMGQTQP